MASPCWPLLLSHGPPATASFAPLETPANPLLIILLLSPTSLFHVLFNVCIIMYVLLFNLLYIYILFSFIIIQLIFNLIFLCIILPAWGTIHCEKHDICFSPQKGHFKPSLLYIHSSNIFFFYICSLEVH